MNNIIAIVLLVVLFLALIILLNIRGLSLKSTLKRMPGWIFALLILAIIITMGWLVYYLISANHAGGGEAGSSPEEITTTEPEKEEVPNEKVIAANCIILREDQIWIDNVQVNMEDVEKYIDEHAESKTRITIVDDYALASLYHSITALCDKKGVKYDKKDEKWIN